MDINTDMGVIIRSHFGLNWLKRSFSFRRHMAPKSSKAAAKKKKRRRGSDIPSEAAAALFSVHVPMAGCTPGKLFGLRSVTKSGLTSDWPSIKRHAGILGALLDQTDGKVPHVKNLTTNFDCWLKMHNMRWSVTDVERCMYNLKSMCSTLQSTKMSETGKPPLKFGMLQVLVDRIKDAEQGDEEPDIYADSLYADEVQDDRVQDDKVQDDKVQDGDLELLTKPPIAVPATDVAVDGIN